MHGLDVEITPVNGDATKSSADFAAAATTGDKAALKGSKLESALDKLGLGKRKVRQKNLERIFGCIINRFFLISFIVILIFFAF